MFAEQVLTKLQVMFPGRQIIVSIRDCGMETTSVRRTTIEYSVQIGVNGEEFHGDSWAKTMAAVRAAYQTAL